MLLFAIPVCDLCKATAPYGKETDRRLSVMSATGKSVGSQNALSKTKSQLETTAFRFETTALRFRLRGLLRSLCGADVRRFLGNANCDEAQAPCFSGGAMTKIGNSYSECVRKLYVVYF